MVNVIAARHYRDRPRNGCGYYSNGGVYVEKVKHAKFRDALIHAVELTERRNRKFEPYPCKRCGFWHVGGKKEGKALRVELGKRAFSCLMVESRNFDKAYSGRTRRIRRSLEHMELVGA